MKTKIDHNENTSLQNKYTTHAEMIQFCGIDIVNSAMFPHGANTFLRYEYLWANVTPNILTVGDNIILCKLFTFLAQGCLIYKVFWIQTLSIRINISNPFTIPSFPFIGDVRASFGTHKKSKCFCIRNSVSSKRSHTFW